MTQHWNALSASAKRWAIVAAVALTIAVVIGALNALGAAPGGPTLSSYATDGDGLAAYAELLASTGHTTTRLREPLDKKRQPPDVTLVAIGQTFSTREARALVRFVAAGGRVVVGSPEAEDALVAVGDKDTYWSGRGASAARPAPGADLAGVGTVRGDGVGEWIGNAEPLLAGGGHVTAVTVPVGSGELIALADPSPITNAFIGTADNAGFAVAIVGAPGRTVVFAEYGHGFGVSDGLGAIPSRWKSALWFAAVAAVVGALSAAKRFGPPDAEPASHTPARVLYVESLASTLARTRDYDAAMGPLRKRAEAALARRPGALSAEDAATLTSPVTSDLDVLALGRVVAKLEDS